MTTRRAIYGPEPWADRAGATLSHWDLWFCLVCLADHDGDWDRLADAIWEGRSSWSSGRDAEGKLAHLADLRDRLEARGLEIRDLALEEELEVRVMEKARRKVLRQELSGRDHTAPMTETPRHRLRERALRGSWDRFPVSPEAFYERFRTAYRAKGGYTKGASFKVAERLESRLRTAEREAGGDIGSRMAAHRALLTAIVEAEDVTDDSFGRVAEVWRDAFPVYRKLPWAETGMAPEAYYRDLCELCVWEDYGLLFRDEVETFRTVPARHADVVEGILLGLADELSGHRELGYQARDAVVLAGYLNVAKGRLERFASVAERVGSESWIVIEAMVDRALEEGRRDVARSVFDVADRPGFHRQLLREKRAKMLDPAEGG